MSDGTSLTGATHPRGGLAARRAILRWAWRLFRHEWRQQILIFALILVAVAATVVGSAVATDTPPSPASIFGTAHDLAIFHSSGPRLSSQIDQIQSKYGRVQLIENEAEPIAGSVETYQLRSQSPRGPFGLPLLSLVSGRYPSTPTEVALTAGLARNLNLRIGETLRTGGASRLIVGFVENPQNLLDEFALVIPGQVAAPTEVSVLFNAPGVAPGSIGPEVVTPESISSSNPVNPETISLAALTIGMLLIALLAIGGFTVLAQRRLRSLGMLASLGASDAQVGLVVRANGVVTGASGAVFGAIVGFVMWLAYWPSLEQSAHHVIGIFALPWPVVAIAVALAIVATYVAASLPARSLRRLSIVAALSGRPAPPKQVHRPVALGIAMLLVSFVLFGLAGESTHGGESPELVGGFVLLVPGVILLAPLFVAAMGAVSWRAPVAVRLALRDLSRYRARSGSALAAISVGVMIAVFIGVFSTARYSDTLDYVGPNLAANQLLIYTQNGPQPFPGPSGPGTGVVTSARQIASDRATEREIAAELGARKTIELDITSATLWRNTGRNFSGPIYVATPRLLSTFGIESSQVNSKADFLSMRPGLSGISGLTVVYGRFFNRLGLIANPAVSCPKASCISNPAIEEVTTLPSGTAAPNTVITESAVRRLGLHPIVAGWLLQSSQPFSAAQVRQAQVTAAESNMTVEGRNSLPTSSAILTWATVFGLAIALAILAMSVGLIRSESAHDLATLAATGASTRVRRGITATTTLALGIGGSVLGVIGGYVAVIGYLRSNPLLGLGALANVPLKFLLILVIAIPAAGSVAAWLLAGREPRGLARQPIE